MGREDWKALKEGAYAGFGEQNQAALTYAEKLTRASKAVIDSDIAALKKHFSEAEIVDIHLLVGLVNLTNRFTDPLGLEVEFPPAEHLEQEPISRNTNSLSKGSQRSLSREPCSLLSLQ